MANNRMLVDERSRDIGSFLVGRLLPFRKKRQVGPFTFIDHMGPSMIGPGRYMDVDQHPHIGLSTLTYLIEGQVEHRDSTGAHDIIKPGSVNFMTAGRGVTHTERTPAALRDGGNYLIHGYQVWVALPVKQEDISPTFQSIPKTDLPSWTHNGVSYTLIAGEGYGRKSPLKVYSPLFMIDIKTLTKGSHIDVADKVKGEIAIVVVTGQVTVDNQVVEAGQMLISKAVSECCIDLHEDTQILLFGGEPLPEERYMDWNFVSSSKDKIKQAKKLWQERLFPTVPGDNTYIPLPQRRQ